MCTFTTNIDAAPCDFLTAYFVTQVDECRRCCYRNKESESEEREGAGKGWERRRRERKPERDRDGERCDIFSLSSRVFNLLIFAAESRAAAGRVEINRRRRRHPGPSRRAPTTNAYRGSRNFPSSSDRGRRIGHSVEMRFYDISRIFSLGIRHARRRKRT